MTDAVTVALIAMPAPTLLAAAALYKQQKAEQRQERIEQKASAIQVSVGAVETKVDGRFSELIDLVVKMSRADGFKDGTQAEKNKGK